MRAPVIVAFVIAVACVAEQASADERSPAVAEALFRDAKRLLEQNQVAEACQKFAESMKMDPTTGTQLNLALCHEKQGKIALAWSEMSQVLASSLSAGNEQRATFARERIAELEKRLAYARFDIAPGTGVTDVTVDGQALGPAAWAVPLPLEAGEHVFTFSGCQKRKTLTVRFNEGEMRRVPLTTLDDGVPRSGSQGGAPSAEPSSTRRTIGWIAGGVGVVGLGFGVGFGLSAISKKSDVDEACVRSACSPAGLSAADDARTAATLSTIGFGVGLVGIAAGTYLLLTSSAKSSGQVRVAPSFAGSSGGLQLRGEF